jgi:hypothetical protein
MKWSLASAECPSLAVPTENVQQENTTRSSRSTVSTPSVSAALASVNTGSPAAMASHFSGEDGSYSLSEMAQRDLDAALQLLADRAQYITGANGAAIALRHDGMQDLLCRASTGSNAPELGALLSTEFGLSGESVRTRKVLRCDDAERDARVNREVCRELKIASVVVMPVVHDDEVMGVFELFSEKAHAFGPRDLSALERLSEMVDTAIRLARATEEFPERLKHAEVPSEGASVENPHVAAQGNDAVLANVAVEDPVLEVEILAAVEAAPEASKNVLMPAVAVPQIAPPPPKPPKRALLWSAMPQAGEAEKSAESDSNHIPPVLRGLSKCEACGFPVSAGRKLCVECEEKKWRGQLKPQSALKQATTGAKELGRTTPASASQTPPAPVQVFAAAAQSAGTFPGRCFQGTSGPGFAPYPPIPATTIPTKIPDVNESKRIKSSSPTAITVQKASMQQKEVAPKPKASTASSPAFVLSAGLEPSQTWFSANKYILGAIAVVAASVAAVLLLR